MCVSIYIYTHLSLQCLYLCVILTANLHLATPATFCFLVVYTVELTFVEENVQHECRLI